MVDRVLAIAATLADDMRCNGCGHPKHEAWNPDSAGWYEVREAECQGCAAVARAGENDRRPRPEVQRWAEDVRPPDVELMPWAPGGPSTVAPQPPQPAPRDRSVG